jgi:NAD-dependent SIR2 family protein deacetylase
VEVNVDETAITQEADEVLRGKAGAILPPLVEVIAAHRSPA